MKATRVYTSLDKRTETRLNVYMDSLTIRPNKNQVITQAIKDFLETEGF